MFSKIGASLYMSVGSRHSSFLCPTSVSVQNDRDMIWYVHKSPPYRKRASSKKPSLSSYFLQLYSQNLFRLVLDRLVNFLDVLICKFLDLILKLFDLILRNILFCKFLKCIVGITTDISYCNLGTLAFFLTSFTSSLRRSSVSSGKTRRIIFPSLLGFNPRSEQRIAFSIALIMLDSHGWIWIIRASGTEMFATCWSGVGAP